MIDKGHEHSNGTSEMHFLAKPMPKVNADIDSQKSSFNRDAKTLVPAACSNADTGQGHSIAVSN